MKFIEIISEFKIQFSCILSKVHRKILGMLSPDTLFEIFSKLRWLRQWWKKKYVSTINHEEVLASVRNEGVLTSRFLFMTFISCTIATLGLLLSSPGVVTGAMLISPLMSPIMSLGFSLCLLDISQMRKALECLVTGVLLVIAISWLIVLLSPIADATPEIMARTQPNLFDLLVAIFSGMAGGYSVIKRRGQTIVGVAIATALMPPLAVVGFGIVTGSAAITKGAFMLFMTNLLAISLTVALMAKFYGFVVNRSEKRIIWQILFVTTIFSVLSVPLGIALKDIAYQTYVTKISRDVIEKYFGDDRSRISSFNSSFQRKQGATIDAVIFTSRYKSQAQQELKLLLTEKTGRNVILSLDQVIVTQDSIAENSEKLAEENVSYSALQAQATNSTPEEKMISALTQDMFFPVDYIKVDAEAKLAFLYVKASNGVTINNLHQFENKLRERYPGWKIKLIPPFQALPSLYYSAGKHHLSYIEVEKLNDIIWALRRWKTRRVKVLGFASTAGESSRFNNKSLAYKRALFAQKKFKESGIKATPSAEYRKFQQLKDERNNGIKSFQRVEIRLATS